MDLCALVLVDLFLLSPGQARAKPFRPCKRLHCTNLAYTRRIDTCGSLAYPNLRLFGMASVAKWGLAIQGGSPFARPPFNCPTSI